MGTLTCRPLPSFDYATITDVDPARALHRRDGGAALGAPSDCLGEEDPGAEEPAESTPPAAMLLSLRHDFPTEWYAFTSGAGDFTATLTMDFFPYLVQSATLTIDSITLYANSGDKMSQRAVAVPAAMNTDLKNTGSAQLQLPADAAVLTRAANREVFVVIGYHAKL